jgi:hypothetical protein
MLTIQYVLDVLEVCSKSGYCGMLDGMEGWRGISKYVRVDRGVMVGGGRSALWSDKGSDHRSGRHGNVSVRQVRGDMKTHHQPFKSSYWSQGVKVGL